MARRKVDSENTAFQNLWVAKYMFTDTDPCVRFVELTCVCVCAGYSVTQSRRLLSQQDETIVTGDSDMNQVAKQLIYWCTDWYIDVSLNRSSKGQ